MGIKDKVNLHDDEILSMYRKIRTLEDRIDELNELIRILVDVIKEYEKKVDEKIDTL